MYIPYTIVILQKIQIIQRKIPTMIDKIDIK